MPKLMDKKEAKAFARFLIWEHKRHVDDLKVIKRKLQKIREKWHLNFTLGTMVTDLEAEYSLDGEVLTEDNMWIGMDEIASI